MTKNTIAIRKPYDASSPVRKSFSHASMAQQSMADECNINNIMKKYEATGLIEHAQNVSGSYGDFTNVEDYHTSINQVIAAQEAFMALPATIRRRFENDPAQMLAFLDDPDNENEAIELGLIERAHGSQNPVPASDTDDDSKSGKKASANPDPAPSSKPSSNSPEGE